MFQNSKLIISKSQWNGSLIWTVNQYPILGTREYTVKFPDGKEHEYTMNIITKNMITQYNHDGNQHLLLDSIIGNKKYDSAIKRDEKYSIWRKNQNVRKRPRVSVYAYFESMTELPWNNLLTSRNKIRYSFQNTPKPQVYIKNQVRLVGTIHTKGKWQNHLCCEQTVSEVHR